MSAAHAIDQGEDLMTHRVLSAAWAPSMGSWESAGTWGWTCPDCGIHQTVDGSGVDLTCAGPEDWRHPKRTGLRPSRETSAPASLNRHLLGAGTLQRVELLGEALELARRAGATEALQALAGFLDREHPHLAGLADVVRERAQLHRTGEL